SEVSVSKKKKICVKRVPLNNVDSAICDLKLTIKNKQIGAPFLRIGYVLERDMNGLALWCKRVTVSAPKPLPKPRSVSVAMRGQSLDSNSPAQITSTDLTPNAEAEKVAAKSAGRAALPENTIYDSSNIYGISAIDGVPFAIHPMFENKLTNPTAISSNFKDLRIKTLSEIENEYNYGFMVERSTANRVPPGVC
ncbi:hypothetical protein FKM82_018550, partial [Ascaphus truei]